MNPTQQTAETIQENSKLFQALNFKKTSGETDRAIAEYFAEKAKQRERIARRVAMHRRQRGIE